MRPVAKRNAALPPGAKGRSLPRDPEDGAKALKASKGVDQGVMHGSQTTSRAAKLSTSKKRSAKFAEPNKLRVMTTGPQATQIIAVGKRFLYARLALGLKQKEVAEFLGFTTQTVSGWESGRRQADPIALVRFANRWGVSLDYLYRGEKATLRHDLFTEIEKIEAVEARP